MFFTVSERDGESTTQLFAEVHEPAPRPGLPDEAAGRASALQPRTVVLLHPTPVDHRFWRGIVPLLGGRYRVVLPDLRGHGQSLLPAVSSTGSTAGAAAVTIEQMGRDMAALLNHLRVEQAVFVGCSIGGYLLYELWRTMPGRVAGLVFCSAKPQADTNAERVRRAEWIAKIEAEGTGSFVDAMLGALLGQGARRDPTLTRQVREMMETMRPEAIIAVQRGLGQRPDSRATAATIAVPSLVIGGEQDTSSTPADLSALVELLRTSGNPVGHERLSQAGHYAPFEAPDVIGALLRSFCDGVLL